MSSQDSDHSWPPPDSEMSLVGWIVFSSLRHGLRPFSFSSANMCSHYKKLWKFCMNKFKSSSHHLQLYFCYEPSLFVCLQQVTHTGKEQVSFQF